MRLSSSSFLYFEKDHPFQYYGKACFHCMVVIETALVWRRLGLQWMVNLVNRRPWARKLRRLWENHLSFFMRGKYLHALCYKPTAP